jgi:hypothetical protein
MNRYQCCEEENAPEPGAQAPSLADTSSPGLSKRLLDGTRRIVPATLLALLPKCPMCLAAYIAAGTGIGISITAAAWLRTLLIAACLASLALIMAARFRRALNRRRQTPGGRGSLLTKPTGASGRA